MINPGRDLDVEVAKKVLKLQVWYDQERGDWLCYHPSQPDRVVLLPKYSDDTDLAYVIVNSLQNQGLYCHVGSTVKDGQPAWRSTFFRKGAKKAKATYGETLPHAICLAALKAISEKPESAVPTSAQIIKFPKK